MSSEMDEGAVCIPNIGRNERAKRQRIGVIFGAVTAVAAVGLVAIHASHLARLGVFLPALMSAYGIAQARAQT